MSKKRGAHPRKKHVRQAAFALTAAATATTIAVAPITPTPKAEAATTYWSTIILDVGQFLAGIFGISIPLTNPIVAPNATAIAQVMQSGGSGTGVIGLMDGALAAGQAVNIVNNNKPNGAYQFALARNPGRANGGFASRFDTIYSFVFGLLGQTTPAVSGNGITSGGYNSQVYDWGVGYDFFSDFPLTPNPVSIANSLAQAFFPVNALGAPIGPMTIKNQQIGNTCNAQVGGTCFTTFVPEWNALLYPLRFPQLVAPLIGLPSFDLPVIGNPFVALTSIANAYEEPLDILINIGYSDVVTAEGPGQWTRGFNQFGTNKEFMSEFLPPDVYINAIGEAASIAFTNTQPLASALVQNTITFLEQAATTIINFIQSIIGNFTGATVSPAAATLPPAAASAAPPAAAFAAPPAAAPPETDEPVVDHGAVAQRSVQSPTAGKARASSAAAEAGSARTDVAAGDETADRAAPDPDPAAEDTSPAGASVADGATDSDGAPTDAREQADTAKERLDAAAERAKDRADQALRTAQDRISRVNERLADPGDQDPDGPSEDTPAGGAATGQGTSSSTSTATAGAAASP